jgi:glycosyltransferase involved in cell wall biosynthesis
LALKSEQIMLSLIIATYNRAEPLRRLLGWLGRQSMDVDSWEVVVAVDGSTDHTVSVLEGAAEACPFQLRWLVQKNGGPAFARDNAIRQCRGERVVIIDDDMEPVPGFLRAHLTAATSDPDRAVVIGRIQVAPNWRVKPLHDVVGEYQRTILHDAYASGSRQITSDGFATGNVSFAKSLYESVGGFDLSFRIDEDRELGVRFQKAGAVFVFSNEASAVHHSDVGPLAGWLRRWHAYGLTGKRVWEKHGMTTELHPLRHYVSGSRINHALADLLLPRDRLIDPFIKILSASGLILQKMGLILLATAPYRAILALQYNRGARDAFGGITGFHAAAKELSVIVFPGTRQHYARRSSLALAPRLIHR